MPTELTPAADELVLPKTSCSVFVSTNLHYLLGNLGIRYVIIAGLLTDQCVSSAVRDACDLGYLVTVPTDACTTYSHERQVSSLDHVKGFCRLVTTEDLVLELKSKGEGEGGVCEGSGLDSVDRQCV